MSLRVRLDVLNKRKISYSNRESNCVNINVQTKYVPGLQTAFETHEPHLM